MALSQTYIGRSIAENECMVVGYRSKTSGRGVGWRPFILRFIGVLVRKLLRLLADRVQLLFALVFHQNVASRGD